MIESLRHLMMRFLDHLLVSQLPGKNCAPGMQVLVQGNQVAIVAKFLLGK